MKLQLNFQIVRFLNYKQRFSDSLPPKKKKLVDLLTRRLVDFAKLAQLCFFVLPMSQGA